MERSCPTKLISLVLLTLSVPQGGWQAQARPDGLPWPDSCQSLSPGNGIPPQTSECPFKMTLDDQETTCDGVIYVTIKGPEPEEFAGFMIQARTRHGKPVGKFLSADDVKMMDCFGEIENTAININYLPKEEIITRWRPDGFRGKVKMHATVAKDYMEQVYWVNLTSKPIKCTKPKYT